MVWRRGQTYSQDLRERVLSADDLSARAAAERFAVSVSYVIKARQRRSRVGAVTPRPQKPPVARKLVHLHEALRARVEQEPDATLAEHREWLFETHAVTAGLTTIWKTLVQLKLTLKKSRCGRPSNCAPTSLLRKAEPRTRESLWRTIGEKINVFSPEECLNYLRNCGYGHPA